MAGDDILEKIICDADVDNLGRSDFFKKSHLLRKEMSHFGKQFTEQEWYDYLLFILESHTFLTSAAQQLRFKGQLKNLKNLKLDTKHQLLPLLP
jgi:hypothetical protein